MSSINSTPRTPRWREIYDELQGQIAGYDYGSRFHTIADVCRKYNVSTITARRVLTELQNAGLVRKIPRRGTVVDQVSLKIAIRYVVTDDTTEKQLSMHHVAMPLCTGMAAAAREMGIDFSIIAQRFVQGLFLSTPTPAPAPGLSESIPGNDAGNGEMGVIHKPGGGVAVAAIAGAGAIPRPLAGGISTGAILHSNIPIAVALALRDRGIPVVYQHGTARHPSIASILSNRKAGAELATRHLLELGHRRIGLICGPVTHSHFRPRFTGYLKALRQAGIKPSWSLIRETMGENPVEDQRAIDDLLSQRNPPTAVFTANDYRAIHVMDHLRGRGKGVRVPEDLSLVGFDNVAESALCEPALTTVDTMLETVGRQCVRRVVEMLSRPDKPSAGNLLIRPKLVVRRSTRAIQA